MQNTKTRSAKIQRRKNKHSIKNSSTVTTAKSISKSNENLDPLYLQLCNDIKAWISDRTYRAGDKLPTERELCEMNKISRATVRRALVELEKQNIITSRQGSGIYVSTIPFQQSLQKFYSFSVEMRKRGLTPSNKILSFQCINSSAQICGQLELEKNSPLYRIVRLRLANNEPHLYETSYIPAQIMPGFTPQEFEMHDLYSLMEDTYGIELKSAKESFKPIIPNQLVASYLGIKKASPCIFFMRITRDLSGRVVEFTESFARGDKFLFEIEMFK